MSKFFEISRRVTFRVNARISKIPSKSRFARIQQRESSTGEQGWWATEWLADRLQLWWRQQLPTNLPIPASGHVICHIKRLAQTASSLHVEGICSYVLGHYRIQRDKLPFFFLLFLSFYLFLSHFHVFFFAFIFFIEYLTRYSIICIFKDN